MECRVKSWSPITSCETVAKLLNLSLPWFLHLSAEDNNSTSPGGCEDSLSLMCKTLSTGPGTYRKWSTSLL